VSLDGDPPGGEPLRRHGTTTTHTLRTVALPQPPDPGSGAAGVRRGRRCEIRLAYVAGAPPEADGSPSRAGWARGVQMTCWLDEAPVELTVDVADPSWAQTGTASWRNSGSLLLPVASGTALVDVEISAFDLEDVLERWTTVPVDTLMDRRAAWLADLGPRP
jgi:hypothetical protein